MEVRPGTAEDAAALEALRLGEADAATLLDSGASLVAQEDGQVTGALLVEGGGTIHGLAVADEAQVTGVARALAEAHVAALQARGVETVRALLAADDADAKALAERWGLRPERTIYAVAAAELLERLETQTGPCYGAIHVQTDDDTAIRRALERFVPRMPDAQLSGPRNG